MNKIHRIVTAYLNSAEGYFHLRRILQDQVKQPRNLYGPMSDRPERWDYLDIRDFTKKDLQIIAKLALMNLDKDLYRAIPDTAIRASLDYVIHSFDKGRYQSKIDAPTYEILFKTIKNNIGL